MAYEAATTNKSEFIAEIEKMAERINGRDFICNFSWSRYGCAVNNYQGTPTSVMVDEIVKFEDEMARAEVKWQAEIFYY